MSAPERVEQVLELMRRLRDPERGCPWDRAQTSTSIAPFTIEEAFEVADAAERHDSCALREELGDLLFHVVFHARIAEEAGEFDFDDVVRRLMEKLLVRHPHVFGDRTEIGIDESNRRWEADKAITRNHIDAGLPRALPALVAALKLQRRAAAVGFDWPERAGARAKLEEELGELEAAEAQGDAASLHEEFGDLLFSLVNWGRYLGLDPEQALRATNRKFVRRFRYIESGLAASGLTPHEADLEQMDALWEEAKRRERAGNTPPVAKSGSNPESFSR